MEIWKSVNGYEGRYEISNFGRVKRLAGKVKKWNGERIVAERILKPAIVYGYPRIHLSSEGKTRNFFVHRLVALHFVDGYTQERQFVNHKDSNTQNPHWSNLEWVTRQENTMHGYKKGRIKAPTHWHAWVLYQGKKVRMKKDDPRRLEI